MKNKFIKFISSLLILASLISCFAVFSFATEVEEGAEEDANSNLHVIFNRDFDDGWEINNGTSITNQNNHIFSIEHEELADYSYNYFAQIESTTDDSSFFELSYDQQPVSGGSILEFNIKIDDYYNVGNILYLRTPGGAATGTLSSICGVSDNKLSIFNYTVGVLDQGWVHLGYVMNFDQTEYVCHSCGAFQTLDGNLPLSSTDNVNCAECGYTIIYHRVKFRVYFSLAEYWDPENAIDGNALSGKLTSSDLTQTYYMDYILKVGKDTSDTTWKKASIDFFRFGPGLGTKKDTAGQKIQFDNLKLYSDPSVPVGEFMQFNDLEGMGYGSKVKTETPTSVAIGSGASAADIINAGVIMKTNSNYLLNNDEKKNIYTDPETGAAYGAPRKIDGQVYVPFEPILNITGYPYLWHSDGISCDISTASGSSVLTVGRKSAVINGQRTELTAAPLFLESEHSDDVYPVVALEDIELFFPGWHLSYDTMGLICICEKENVFNRNDDLTSMLKYMKKFVFDYYTGEQFYDAVKEYTNNFDHPYIMADQDQMDYIYAVYTGEIDNPTYKSWLDKFVRSGESTYNTYTTQPSGPNVAKEYLADGSIRDWSEKDPDYKLLWYEMSNFLENGINHGLWVNEKYDYGQYPFRKNNVAIRPYGYVGQHYNDGAEIETGRVGAIQGLVNEIETIATAYIITRDLKYAQLCWEMCESFMKLRHWGQHQFLAVAEVGHSLACVYDWLYDVWTVHFNYDTNALAQAMYEKIVWFGYAVTMDKGTTDWFEDYSIQPGTTNYNDMVINWNAVCTSGLTMCELAIIGAQDKNGVDFKTGTDYTGKAYTEIDFTTTRGHFDNSAGLNILYYTMESNFYTLCTIGLNQYPPDGSFIESPGYWSFATNNLADMIWSLTTALGDDLGLLDFGGMDTTWYFPIYTEFHSDEKRTDGYCYWAFHDTSPSEAETCAAFFICQQLGDTSLAAYRLQQIEAGKSVDIKDILGYKPEFSNLTDDDIVLEKDYVMENLDGVTTRSNWEHGAIFTGIMGDANNITAHGQVDCGNWIYSNLNTIWFMDMGADEYDLYGYFDGAWRYNYYRSTGEGNNLLIVTNVPDTMPSGQLRSGKGPFQYDEYISNEYGIAAMIDATSVFAPYSNRYYRGLFFTNSRSTVVIQDQVALKSALDLAWIAHTEIVDVSLSDDGRTAYLKKLLTDGAVHTLRVSIVEERRTDLKFEIIDAGVNTFLLESTWRQDFSESMGGEPEYARNKYKRLVIRDDAAMNFNVAIVIEMLGVDESTASPVKYDYQDMRDWVPAEKYTGLNDGNGGGSTGGSSGEVIETLTPKDIINYANDCKRFVDTNYAFTTRTTDFFKCLARVNNGFNSLNIDRYQGVAAMQTAYANYKEYMKQYSAFKDDINAKLYMDITLTRSFSGL